MTASVKIRQAVKAQDHDTLVKIARKSCYISAFGSIMFSSDQAYEKGWIRLAEDADGNILGFTCVRHKSRTPETMLYFIMIDPEVESQGVGQALMRDLETQTPHRPYALKVELRNERAIAFYERLGYVATGPAYESSRHPGQEMRKELA